jgi:type IV pilus assembly protein PilA
MKAVRTLKTQAGFSLIELMIVVAIIGILASIAVPNFQKFQRRAKQTEGKGYLAGIYSAEQGFRAEWNVFTTDLKCIGFKDATIVAGGADGIAGKGQYRAGYSSDAGPFPGGATCAAGFSNAAPVPTAGITLPAAVSQDIAPTATTFKAASQGDLNGTQNDIWTIDEVKTVANFQSGL